MEPLQPIGPIPSPHWVQDSGDRLLEAIERNHLSCVNLLLAQGSSLLYFNKKGHSPLHLASRNGNKHIVEALLRAALLQGVSVDIEDPNKTTPLDYAAGAGHQDVVTLLLDAGADAAHVDLNNGCSLYFAIEHDHTGVILKLCRSMSMKGASFNIKHNEGHSPLTLAAAKGYEEAVNALVDWGADLDYAVQKNWTALFYAADQGHKNIVSILLRSGADAGFLTPDAAPATALQIAQLYGDNKELYLFMRAANERVFEFTRELRRRKLLAHIFGTSGTTSLLHPSKQIQVSVPLTAWYAKDIWKIIVKRGQIFFQKFPQILETCRGADVQSQEWLLNRYHNDKMPIVIRSGSNTHYVSIVLWKKYFILCDRGVMPRTTCEVLQIDPKDVDFAFIHKLQSLRKGSHKNYVSYLNSTFPQRLEDPNRDTIEFQLGDCLALERACIDNCTWTNSEAAIFVLLVLEELRRSDSMDHQKIDEIATRQKKVFLEWCTFMKESELKKYVGPRRLTSASHLYPRDWELLERVKAKAPAIIAEKFD